MDVFNLLFLPWFLSVPPHNLFWVMSSLRGKWIMCKWNGVCVEPWPDRCCSLSSFNQMAPFFSPFCAFSASPDALKATGAYKVQQICTQLRFMARWATSLCAKLSINSRKSANRRLQCFCCNRQEVCNASCGPHCSWLLVCKCSHWLLMQLVCKCSGQPLHTQGFLWIGWVHWLASDWVAMTCWH